MYTSVTQAHLVGRSSYTIRVFARIEIIALIALPNAREDLARLWKDRIRAMIESGSAAGSGGDAGGSDAALPYEDD